jgi:hypothetical protein
MIMEPSGKYTALSDQGTTREINIPFISGNYQEINSLSDQGTIREINSPVCSGSH